MAGISKTLLIGVDGTGTGNQVEYRKKFTQGFVYKILQDSTSAQYKIYRRGPGNLGLGSLLQDPNDLAREVINHHRNGFTRIFMTGFT